MKSTMFGRILMMAALLTSAGFAATHHAEGAPESDASLARTVSQGVLMSPSYTIFDDIGFRIDNGNVELFGTVTAASTRSDIEKSVRAIPGVAGLTDQIQILPASFFDDRLRIRIARAIYTDPEFPRVAGHQAASIHITVDNGHVTLTGVVDSNLEKQLAATRAATAGLTFGPIVNNLEVLLPPATKS